MSHARTASTGNNPLPTLHSAYSSESLFWKLTTKVRVIMAPIEAVSGATTVDKVLGLATFFRFYATVKEQFPALLAGSAAPATGTASSGGATPLAPSVPCGSVPFDGLIEQCVVSD